MTVCIKTFKTIRNQLPKKSLKGLLDAIVHSNLDYRRILLNWYQEKSVFFSDKTKDEKGSQRESCTHL